MPGHGGGFAYWSGSKYVGQASWVTYIQEYTISKGAIVSCSLGGVSHVVRQVSFISVGLTGAGGGCSGDPRGAESAASGQGFLSFHIKGAWSIIATARKTFTASGTDAFRLTLGLGWGK